MMDEAQWSWLETQLNIPTEVTLIGSGVQVLPPVPPASGSRSVPKELRCAYDTQNTPSQQYRGSVNHTIGGLVCQNWHAQSPHKHSYTPENYPRDGLGAANTGGAADGTVKVGNNYCRDPGGYEGAVWCYTTDPAKRWDFCSPELDGDVSEYDAVATRLNERGADDDDVCPSDVGSDPAEESGGCTARGTDYGSWAQLPAERERLLRMVQASVAAGRTRAVVFVSGSENFAEMSQKTVPALAAADGAVAPAVVVHELTGTLGAGLVDGASSGKFFNDNRISALSCDTQEDGYYVNRCAFPFEYDGVLHTGCTMAGSNTPWCYFETVDAPNNNHAGVSGQWGQCGSFVNNVPAAYGSLHLDFAAEQLTMEIVAPGRAATDDGVVESHTVQFASSGAGAVCDRRRRGRRVTPNQGQRERTRRAGSCGRV
jgi:hypothetical protein